MVKYGAVNHIVLDVKHQYSMFPMLLREHSLLSHALDVCLEFYRICNMALIYVYFYCYSLPEQVFVNKTCAVSN